MKSILVLLSVILLTSGVTYYVQRPASKVDKFLLDIPYHPDWEVAAPLLSNEVFSQPFSYLKGGSQCYTYISQDQQFVIKFFKKNHLLPKSWLNYLPFSFLDNYRYQKIDKHIERQRETFSSYKIAYNELREETGLLYVHLYKTDCIKKTISLIEREGEENLLDLDRATFILQKKAELLATKMAQCQTAEEIATIYESLLNLITKRCKKGLKDLDNDIGHNYGFIEDQVIQIDVGKVIVDESIKNSYHLEQELNRVRNQLDLLRY